MVARSAMMAYEDRVEPRDETLCRTWLFDAGGARHSVTVVNASLNGFMARAEADLSIGERVVLTLPVIGDRTAEIRWSLGGRVGAKFAQELPASLYPCALAAMR
ncbi:PilZ domain-containing protein [Sphingomonas sp. BK235]|jgi:hypothetical protein|uniref:PilZ domain-containing protein n=1 Tax=Sphingomonas sp. BK235 TaxID=2512131 RepID=UPI00104CCDB5|nr:PilZ domain-containing protein [Sphingomonas sp. BK235]TCP35039.1 PilZ domain-containing protein [Sphingomonas sp. BK235]